MAEREVGTIKFFNDSRGFGFITREGQEDIFFHISELMNTDSVAENDKVEFEQGIDERSGRNRAVKVKLLEGD